MNEDIFTRYPQVAGNPLAMAALCQELRTRGMASDAFAIGSAAMTAAPENMEVRDLVRGLLAKGVPSWHLPMLRDAPRNQCYRTAIERAVRPGMRVLEIGTGAGLLALLAARAGAEVVTCEADPIVAAAARENIRRNGMADRIRVISKFSNDLLIGEDLDEPADLLMSELFDDILFGDNIVEVIADARERLLKPGAQVIPPRSALRCALVSLPRPAERPIGDVEGFDLSAFNFLSPAGSVLLRAKSADAEIRSEVTSALAMDFERELPFGPIRERHRLISHGGRIDGVAQWLRIDFGDGVFYENDPFASGSSHWGAPVFPLVTPIETQKGDAIDVMVRVDASLLIMHAERARD